MNILFLFIQYPEDKNASFLTKDLPDEFSRQGDNVFVATIRERKLGLKTSVSLENGKHVLRIRTGNMFNNTSKIEKALSMLAMNNVFLKTIKKNWGDIEFDLIVGSTPYTANYKLIRGLKHHYQCQSFLILWDLFPQNAKDLGLIKNKLLFNFFKKREIKSLESFDHIGCMSAGNIQYVEENYPTISKDKLSIFPLWGNKELDQVKIANKREDIGLNEDDFVLVFGGNMGLPQNLLNVVRLANEVKQIDKIKFLFIGQGAEEQKIKELSDTLKLKNTTFIGHVDRNTYQAIIRSCDIGLVSLNPKFTVPNFPSKTMDYLKFDLPILASLDRTALNDYGNFIEKKAKVGLCSDASDMNSYKTNLLKLYTDRSLYNFYSDNCKKVFNDEFNIESNYKRIIDCI
jgi:glycosyltransferase involved in cell wall biosynthesis